MQIADNNPLPSLDAGLIKSICLSNDLDVDVAVLQTVDSTNAWLLERQTPDGMAPAQDDQTRFAVCAAEHQTVGRGRRGKTWHSPNGGVTFSVKMKLAESIEKYSGLSVLVGAMLCDQLRALGVDDAKVKWPNDVWVNEKKLSGILIESIASASSVILVVGIGINYRHGDEVSVVEQPITDLHTVCSDRLPDRSKLIGALAAEIIHAVANDNVAIRLAALAVKWRDYDALWDTQIEVSEGGQTFQGRAIGIASSGQLRVKTEQGVRVFNSAEISVRSRRRNGG